MDDNVTRNKTQFIDVTILNTPKPQASSTVEKTTLPSSRLGEIMHRKPKNSNYDYIPTRDTDASSQKSNASKSSLASSLGLLQMDDLEDIQDNLTKTQSQRNSVVNDKLLTQRMLAQKAMERADSKSKPSTDGLPSYLLKPSTDKSNNDFINTPTKTESTINLSDLERSIPKSDKISFESRGILARSSSIGGVHKSENNIRNPSPLRCMFPELTSQYESIYNDILNSDMNINEICSRNSQIGMKTESLGALTIPLIDTINPPSIRIESHTQEPNTDSDNDSDSSWGVAQDSLIAKLQNELFTPAELAQDKLLADELSWRNANDYMPTDLSAGATATKNRFSCFSDASSCRSKIDENLSIGEFFKRKTEDVDKLDLKSSPTKKHTPIPLINLTSYSSQEDSPTLKDTVSTNKTLTPSRQEDNSIMSVNGIINMLSNMNVKDTPIRIADMLLKKSKTSAKIDSKSTKENAESAAISDKSIIHRSPTTTSVTDLEILRDKTNLTSDIPQSEKQTPNLDNSWSDAMPKLKCPDETLSIITNSSSHSFSELEFSDENRSSSSASGDENSLKITTQQPWRVCVDLPTKFEIHLTSQTNHWLQVTIVLGEIKLANDGVHNPKQIVKIMPIMDEVLLKSNATECYTFTVTSFLSNDIKVTFHVEVKDMATKLKNIMEYEVILKSETPNLKITTELIDFELNPEGSQKTLALQMINNSNFNLPLIFTISQEYEWIFMFGSSFESTQSKSADCSDSSNTSDIIHIEYSTVVLANRHASIPLVMRSPSLDQFTNNTSIVNVDGTVRMYLSCGGETKKFLRSIRLEGRIGLTRIKFKTTCLPLTLQLGQTKPLQVKNAGVVPMNLAVCFVPDDGCFQADQKQILLNPETIGTIQITYQGNSSKSPKSLSTQIKRTLRLVYGSTGPNFIFPLEATSSTGTLYDSNCSSPRHKNSRESREFSRPNSGASLLPQSITPTSGSRCNSQTSDTGTVNYFSDGKLPIDATTIELVWGCIRPGKSSIQEFVLRNRSSQRLRIQVIIQNVGASSSTAIGIASLQSPNFRFVKDGCITDMNLSLLLHKKESRTISVAFCPHSKGAAAARLIFKPLISEVETGNLKPQTIQLYGYGGYTLIDIQKVAKDSAGRMWLSFGRLDYHRETLHQTFILRNTGTLAAFACLNVSCKALYPFMDSSVKISPTEIVIDPNREVEICVSFTPRPEDFKYIDSKSAGLEVAEIASVQILSGSEATRARIRRLFNKITAQNHHQSPSPTSRSALQSLSTEFLVPRLSATFPGEQTSSDANLCRESPGAMRNLLRDLDNRELILTIERDIGTECNLLAPGIADESFLFKSLVCPADNTTLQVTGRKSGGFCTIEPRHLMLAPPIKCADTVVIRSQHSRPMPFEINVPSTAVAFGVHVTPAEGLLQPNEYTVITVQCAPGQIRSQSTCNIMVYVENEVMDIEIKIQFIQGRHT